MSITEWSGEAGNGKKWQIHRGDSFGTLQKFEAQAFQTAVTSPPYYWQRDYDVAGQIGQEATIQGYVDSILSVMSEVRRVLRNDGTLFLNLGDTYYSGKGQPKGPDRKNKSRRFGLRAVDASGLGVPRKTIIGIPWRVALAMVDQGWVLRAPIIWQRAKVLPEPTAIDRPWRTYEFLFMFSKKPRYKFYRDRLEGAEDVWSIPFASNKSRGLHNAAFPEALAEKAIICSSDEDDCVLDPFCGTATTLLAALRNRREAVGIDLSYKYCEFAAKRVSEI